MPGTNAPAKTCGSLLRHSIALFEVLSWYGVVPLLRQVPFSSVEECGPNNFTTSLSNHASPLQRGQEPEIPAANDRSRQGQVESSGSSRQPIKRALLPPSVHAPPVTVLWTPTLTPPLFPGTSTPGLSPAVTGCCFCSLPVTPAPFAELPFNRHPQCSNAI